MLPCSSARAVFQRSVTGRAVQLTAQRPTAQCDHGTLARLQWSASPCSATWEIGTTSTQSFWKIIQSPAHMPLANPLRSSDWLWKRLERVRQRARMASQLNANLWAGYRTTTMHRPHNNLGVSPGLNAMAHCVPTPALRNIPSVELLKPT